LEPGRKKKFIKRLRNRYRLIVMNDETLQERASVVLKPMNVFILFSVLLVIFTTFIVLVLFYTPLKEYVPGFDKTDYLRIKLEQDARLDSLEKVNRQYFDKWKTIDKIIEGKFDAADTFEVKKP